MKSIILSAILICYAFNVSAQEKNSISEISGDNFRVQFAYGLYKSSYVEGDKPGTYLHSGFGFKMNKNFWLNLDIIHSEARGGLEIYPLLNSTSNVTNWYFMPNFTKDFKIKRKSIIKPMLGFFLNREYTSRLGYETVYDQNNNPYLADLAMSDEATYTAGIMFGLSFNYEVNKNLFLGIEAYSYTKLYLTIESFMVGPKVEIRI